jgi:Subtilase family
MYQSRTGALLMSRRADKTRVLEVIVNDWIHGLEPKVAEQVDYIAGQFSQCGRAEIGIVTSGGGVGFMYAEGQILVREDYLDRVLEILDPHFTIGRYRPVIAGVLLVPIELSGPGPVPAPSEPAPSEPARAGEDVRVPRPSSGKTPSVIAALTLIDEALGEGVATPNHVVTVAPVVAPCPATEPQQAYEGTEPAPGVCTKDSGAGVLIYVADTGLLEAADTTFSWLHGVQRAATPGGNPQGWDPCPAPTGTVATLTPYTAHGTFVAGVARCMAPAADVIVSNVFNVAGSALESDFIADLVTGLALGVDIFHLSVATPTRKSKPMLTFQAWLKLLADYKGVVCVVAAGNNGSRHPSWPAAFSQVVAVGALGADWRNRASFSNYGGWVDVYAPGRDMVNAYASGIYICQDVPYRNDRRDFYGMAKWSGTSFSTPVVTGLIAARMSRTGENGQEAAAALLAQARAAAIPGVGAVLLPCHDGDGDRDRCCGSSGCCCERRC